MVTTEWTYVSPRRPTTAGLHFFHIEYVVDFFLSHFLKNNPWHRHWPRYIKFGIVTPPAAVKLYAAINLNTTKPPNISQKLCLATGNIRYCASPDVFKQSSVTSSVTLSLCANTKRSTFHRGGYDTKNKAQVIFCTVPGANITQYTLLAQTFHFIDVIFI